MNITKELVENQRAITEKLFLERVKLENRYNAENKLFRLMLDNYNSAQALTDYEEDYLKAIGKNTPLQRGQRRKTE